MSQVDDKPSIDDAMEHFGVQGMRWGVRRNPDTGVRPIATALNDSKFGKVSIANADRYNARQAQKQLKPAKGMHYEARKGKKTTGISRTSGALIDRNARRSRVLTDARSGVKYKRQVALGKKLMGDKKWQSNVSISLKDMNDQDTRLRAGKKNAMDRLDAIGHLGLIELGISITPKH